MLKDLFLKFRSDAKFRNGIEYTLIGIFIFVILIVLFCKNCTSMGEEPEVVGAKMAVQCPKCNHKEIRRIVRIEDPENKCTKCGTSLKEIWKCQTCSFEYPFTLPPLTKKPNSSIQEILQERAEMSKCPNCKSTNTYQASIQILESKKK